MIDPQDIVLPSRIPRATANHPHLKALLLVAEVYCALEPAAPGRQDVRVGEREGLLDLLFFLVQKVLIPQS